ncbi:glucosylglycerol ABC transporter membrane protein [Hydrogenispora ethanolica]|uniref:Glucosylglycerol ABC transporter membrane protein n=1 Tax=Hydrogenispora ethanolica TaxID=1082276 RepID=A0A4R1R0I1_HYDET|nr:carbohydrate ABC transporter permease [Hydrogenispora ethanolica]TCL58804.1 glucosylglycerol ABC transporter membrane protein [Hydrogenispora ethanolica]
MKRNNSTAVHALGSTPWAHWILAVMVVAWLTPTLMLFVSSLRPVDQMMTSGWWTAFGQPGQFTLENYRTVLASKGIGTGFVNSLLITIPSTILPIIIGAMAAYPLSFFRFPGRKAIFITIIAMQIVPLQTVLIPVLLTLKGLRLNGTFLGIWLAHTAFGLPLCIYLFRNFFAQLPYSLIEAAKIDGAGNLQIFVRLIAPLSKPAFASLAIFQFLWVWNDLLVALVLLGDPALSPLTVRLSSLLGSLDAGWNVMTPAAFSSLILPLVIFVTFQKYFVRGILGGAVKG